MAAEEILAMGDRRRPRSGVIRPRHQSATDRALRIMVEIDLDEGARAEDQRRAIRQPSDGAGDDA